MPLPSNYVTSRGVQTKRGRRMQDSAVIHDTFVDVAAAVTNGWSASHAGAGAAGTTNMTLGGAHGVAGFTPHARNVVITVTHGSAVVAMSGIITGYDISGNLITEAWSVTAGGTTKTFTGKKAFKRVTQITEVIAASAAANTIIAGSGIVLGLSANVALGGVGAAVKELAVGSIVTTGTLVAASTAATDDSRGTYLPATAPNGSNDYDVWYLSDTPEYSA